MTIDKSKLVIFLLLIVSWFPVSGVLQGLVYVFPIFLFIFLLTTKTLINKRGLFLAFIFFGISILSILFNFNTISIFNYFFAFFTYFSLFLLIFKVLDSFKVEDFFSELMSKICIFEFIIGVCQIFLSTGGLIFSSAASGDNVTGTLLDNSHLYVVKMLLSFLYLTCVFFRGDNRGIIKFGILSSLVGAILGSALLTTGIFFGCVFLFLMFVPKFFYKGYSLVKISKIKFYILLFSLFSFIIFLLTQEQNYRLIVGYYETAIDSLNGSRDYGLNKVISSIEVLKEQYSTLYHTFFGYGFGHYSSRAALILSGEYLRSSVSFFPVFISPTMNEYLIPYWNRSVWSVQYQDGVMNQPFFSILSIIVELGILGLILFIYLICFSIKYLYLFILKYNRRSAYALLAIVFVFPFILLTDNWLEYPSIMLQLIAIVYVAMAYQKKG